MTIFKIDKDQVEETQELMKLLDQTNKKFNKFKYKTDKDLHNTEDYWTAQIEKFNAGDCDDYALSKRKSLMLAGVPYQCLFPTVCLAGGEGHLVLVIRTNKNDYVLDNIEKKVIPVTNVDYKWVFRLDPLKNKWVKLGK
jgi:predicted transglutaminase-like cysteine proteinase